MKVTLSQLWDKLEDMEKILIGNGGIGLCETVRTNTHRIKRLEKKPFRMKEWLIFMVTLGTFAVLIYMAFFK